MPSSQCILAQTKAWVSSVVIGENFCPFARREVENEAVHYSIIDSPLGDQFLEDALLALMLECKRLDEKPAVETTLMVFPERFNDFHVFLDLLELANNLMADKGYESIYQLASFHPDYCFADAPEDDPANFTNRSPYPMLHLIREASIERVLQSVDDPESIPERNVSHARALGFDHMKGKLKQCLKQESE